MAPNAANRKQRPGHMSVVAQNPTAPPLIGGRQPVFLRAAGHRSEMTPQFLRPTFLPGRGMNLFQARALCRGWVKSMCFVSPSLQDAAKQLNGRADDFMGVHSFRFGGAILLPFANRIRGTPSARRLRDRDRRYSITTSVCLPTGTAKSRARKNAPCMV